MALFHLLRDRKSMSNIHKNMHLRPLSAENGMAGYAASVELGVGVTHFSRLGQHGGLEMIKALCCHNRKIKEAIEQGCVKDLHALTAFTFQAYLEKAREKKKKKKKKKREEDKISHYTRGEKRRRRRKNKLKKISHYARKTILMN